MKAPIRLIFIITVTTFFACEAKAQAPNILHDTLYSAVLQEKRALNIILPKDTFNQYEIIYCLDDVAEFQRMEWGFLHGEGFIPKNTILVGITNTRKNGADMRDRDFTPTATGGVSGGADQFLQFIKKELMPHMQQQYKAGASGHTLYGGSLGGLFVMYVFLTDPDLFTSYIAIDPSLWWDHQYLNKLADKKINTFSYANNTLFIAGRKGIAFDYMGISGMDSILRAKAPAALDWTCIPFTNETHYSTNFKGFWEGLKFSYGGFYASTGGYNTSRKIYIKPTNGIVLKDQPFTLFSYNLNPDRYIHYTTDGSIPDQSSPTLKGEETPVALRSDATIHVKSIGKRTVYNREATAYLKTGNVIPASPKPAGVQSGGLHYACYEGEPDLKKLLPTKTGIADETFDINQLSKQPFFYLVKEGFIEITAPGYYIFEMGPGNEKTKVYLAGRQILGAHFEPGDGENYVLPLEKGFYPYRVVYFHQKDSGPLPDIYLKLPGRDDFPMPLEMQYSKR
ncbi:alpha/beta hydrolase-fold protein [Chitinophaga arvensicola]|uniref:Chitobiase/beta-hexosaminidase C-terminal domain-containing protein n=1 Tax=Chitinophaga arvensicola TaxID=29529 RepID=A0A1I0RN92_9BACT|nr:alpha/beta hydrolase-fold protein [Chitinophaga arvensicola]SEW42707.1 Chitobiase/beta-hexosaminidase C-terminal domain-containing protein [Chitinophaga arvensicola]